MIEVFYLAAIELLCVYLLAITPAIDLKGAASMHHVWSVISRRSPLSTLLKFALVGFTKAMMSSVVVRVLSGLTRLPSRTLRPVMQDRFQLN